MTSDVSNTVRTLAIALDEGVCSCRAASLRSAEAVVIPECTRRGMQSLFISDEAVTAQLSVASLKHSQVQSWHGLPSKHVEQPDCGEWVIT